MESCPPGTTVRIKLKTNPFDASGIFSRTYDDNLVELVQRLVPERSVPIEVIEEYSGVTERLESFCLAEASPEEVFDALYPRLRSHGDVDESQRVWVRDYFVKRATEVLDESGARVGLAYIEPLYAILPRGLLTGVCTVNGFLADEHPNYIGYLYGRQGRASRDRAEPVASSEQLKRWVREQVDRRRQFGEFGVRFQLMMSGLLYRCYGGMPDDARYCMIDRALVGNDDIRAWIAENDEIIMSLGFPLTMLISPLCIINLRTYEPVELPPGWLYPADWGVMSPFHTAIDENRDERFRFARADHQQSWQKRWWRLSGSVDGAVLRMIAEVWECDIEDLLRPVEERGWGDFREIGLADGSTELVAVYVLHRPE